MRSRHLPSAILIAIALLLLPLTPALAQDLPQPIALGDAITGTLNDENVSDSYIFEARAGDQVTIAMGKTSGDLDPLVSLYDSAGTELAFDDDGGGAPNARISDLYIPVDGDYTIEAKRFQHGQSGDYALTLRVQRATATPAPTRTPRPTRTPVLTRTPLAGIVDGDCSLRDAIRAANEDRASGGCPAGNGADTIRLRVDVTLRSALPKITSEIANDANEYSISGDGRYRIFYIEPRGALGISDVTRHDGKVDAIKLEGWDADYEAGGAIVNLGNLSISGSSVSNNSAKDGGAIYNFHGDVRITGSRFTNNSAKVDGGAIVNLGELSISVSSFSDNSASYGGAIRNEDEASVTISSSTFSGNSARTFGGAIYNIEEATLAIRSTGLYRNSAPNGGAIHHESDAAVSIYDSSFYNNGEEGDGGAIYSISGYEISVSNNNFSNNRPNDCKGHGC